MPDNFNSSYKIIGKREKVKGRISELIDISVGFGFWCDKRARHLPNRAPPVQYQSTSGRVNFIITVNRQK